MGKTCCTGRNKSVTTTEELLNLPKLRKASYLEETGEPNPTWYLQGSNDIKYDLRSVFTPAEESDISLILRRYGTLGKETAKAIANCYELSIAGQREARKVVITSEAVYFSNAEHIPNVLHRVFLRDIFLVSLAQKCTSALIHSLAAQSDVWFTGTQTGDILQAVQKHRFDLTRLYIPYETVRQRGSLRYRLNNVDLSIRSSAQSELSLQTAAIIVRFGTIGEHCCLSQTCVTEHNHRRRKCILLLTSKAMYTLTAGKVERLAFAETTAVKVVGPKVLVTCGEEERSWTLPANVSAEIERLRNSCNGSSL